MCNGFIKQEKKTIFISLLVQISRNKILKVKNICVIRNICTVYNLGYAYLDCKSIFVI